MPALLAFLKGQAAKDKKGPTLDEMVELAAELVPEAKGQKRALLLSAYQSVAWCVYASIKQKGGGRRHPSMLTWLFIPPDCHHQ